MTQGDFDIIRGGNVFRNLGNPDADGENLRAVASQRVCVLGATGTIGRATAAALVRRGHEVICFVRKGSRVGGSLTKAEIARLLDGAEVRVVDPTDAASVSGDGFAGERFDAVVSCMA